LVLKLKCIQYAHPSVSLYQKYPLIYVAVVNIFINIPFLIPQPA